MRRILGELITDNGVEIEGMSIPDFLVDRFLIWSPIELCQMCLELLGCSSVEGTGLDRSDLTIRDMGLSQDDFMHLVGCCYMFTTTGSDYKADESMTEEFLRRIDGLEHLRMYCMNCLSNFMQEQPQDGMEPAHGHELNLHSKMLKSRVLTHFASLGVDVSKGEYHSNRLIAYKQVQTTMAPGNQN